MTSVTERCKIHSDEIYTFYCGTHDMVYCPVCIEAFHGECINIYFINEAPLVQEKAEASLKEQFTEIVANIECKREPIEAEFAAFMENKTKLFNELNSYRDGVIERLDDIIRKARDDIQSAFQQSEDIFNEDLEKLSIILTAVDCAKSKSNLGVKKSNEQALVDLKLGHYRFEAVKDMMKSLKLSRDKKVVPDLVLNTDALCFDSENLVRKPQKSNTLRNDKVKVKSTTEVEVMLADNPLTSDVTGMCALPDKTFLICDYNNRFIKRINDVGLIRSCPVKFDPFDACVLSEREIAVTSPKQRQIYMLSTHYLRKLRSFRTDKPCKGIDSNFEHIFAVSTSLCPSQSPGSIYEYTKDGVTIRAYDLTFQSSIPLFPVRLCVDKQGLVVFADPHHGLFSIDLDEKLTHLHEDVNISGLCKTGQGRILMCRVQSNTVCILTEEGEPVSTFEVNDLHWPVSMAYEKESSTLAIGSLNSESVHVVELDC